MNRLIIIGNGFDLAHGLKTSFKDFIADYLYNVITQFGEEDQYHDKLISLSYKEHGGVRVNVSSAEKSIDVFNRILGSNRINVKFNSVFFHTVFQKINNVNWVDIEVVYYTTLVANKKSPVNVKKLNKQFAYLKDMLLNYLQRQEQDYNKNIYSEELLSRFESCFNPDEILLHEVGPKQTPSSTLFLNFNYTNILRRYYRNVTLVESKQLNYIHGSLDNEFGNPVFGYGDEFNKHYSEIEDLNDNEYFRFIKSFEYSKNQNYFRLMNFINASSFQVEVYGHSCGLSDRTMLNKIFEHLNCKSIKLYYYGGDEDFTDKVFNISRHFNDKTLLREKVVPLNLSRTMPQPYEEYELLKS